MKTTCSDFAKFFGCKDDEDDEDEKLMDLNVFQAIFGTRNPSDAQIMAKFGNLKPSVSDIHNNVDGFTLRSIFGTDKPTGKQVADALVRDGFLKMQNLEET